eukprot:gene1640-biopygen293
MGHERVLCFYISGLFQPARRWVTGPQGSQDTGAGVARAWRGLWAFLAWVARAWRGCGAGLSCDPRGHRTLARAWRGHGAGVARAWRGRGAGVARAWPVTPGSTVRSPRHRRPSRFEQLDVAQLRALNLLEQMLASLLVVRQPPRLREEGAPVEPCNQPVLQPTVGVVRVKREELRVELVRTRHGE